MIYREELGRAIDGVRLDLALTRSWPSDWSGLTGRVDDDTIRRVTFGPETRPWVYVCGPTGFVEALSAAMVRAGHPPERIKTERFGPTGRDGS